MNHAALCQQDTRRMQKVKHRQNPLLYLTKDHAGFMASHLSFLTGLYVKQAVSQQDIWDVGLHSQIPFVCFARMFNNALHTSKMYGVHY